MPIIGDVLDNLFKSNLRNLTLLEDWLLSPNGSASTYHILLMPETDEFLPMPSTRYANGDGSGGGGGLGGWFGWGANSRSAKAQRSEEREAERLAGRVRRTRRMEKDEALWWGPNETGQAQTQAQAQSQGMAGAYTTATDQGTPGRSGPSRATRSQRVQPEAPGVEALD